MERNDLDTHFHRDTFTYDGYNTTNERTDTFALRLFTSKAILNLQQKRLELHDLDIKIKSENKLIFTTKIQAGLV